MTFSFYVIKIGDKWLANCWGHRYRRDPSSVTVVPDLEDADRFETKWLAQDEITEHPVISTFATLRDHPLNIQKVTVSVETVT